MASHHDEQDLPKTWPFTFGSFLILVAMVWFCGHFALEDVDAELPATWAVFWGLIIAAVVIMAAGAIYNIRKHPRRR